MCFQGRGAAQRCVCVPFVPAIQCEDVLIKKKINILFSHCCPDVTFSSILVEECVERVIKLLQAIQKTVICM